MSESIYTLLDTLTTETSVPGAEPKMQGHSIPRKQLPTSEQFESAELLEKWARDNGCLHACLQKGVRSHVIDCRAVFKACKKDDTWTNAYGQKNLDAYSWKVQTKPDPKGSKAVSTARETDCFNAIKAGLDAGFKKNQLETMLTATYGEEIVKNCFTALKA